MSPRDSVEKDTDWYELICQELKDLHEDVRAGGEDEDQPVVPSDHLFELVKSDLGKLRQSPAGNARNVPIPFVWLGPEGQIGLTWKFNNASIDLIYGNKLLARKTIDSIQEIIDPSLVAASLVSLAA